MAKDVIRYKKSRFSTRLPKSYLYTASHGWLERQDSGHWRVGLTKFATRMLGELVELEFNKKLGEKVAVGEVIGWIEGFKALSDVYAVASGKFVRENPELIEDPEHLLRSPYGSGWLYEVEGTAEPNALSPEEYIELLDTTIQAMLDAEAA